MNRARNRSTAKSNLTWRILQAGCLILTLLFCQALLPAFSSAAPLADKGAPPNEKAAPGADKGAPGDDKGDLGNLPTEDGAVADGAFDGLAGVVRGAATAVDMYFASNPGTNRLGPLYTIATSCNVNPTNVSAGAAATTINSPSTGDIGAAGTIMDRVITTHNATTQTSTATSVVQNLSLPVKLAGTSVPLNLLKFGGVTARSATTASASSVSSSGSVQLTGLSILGVNINANPAPNTVLNVAGVGQVYLNTQTLTTSGNNKSMLQVTAIDLRIKATNLVGFPAGTRILIGQVNSGFDRLQSRFLTSGQAYALNATGINVGPVHVNSGPFATASISCTGGTSTGRVDTASVPAIMSSEAMSSTVSGVPNGPNGAIVKSHTQLGNTDLLGGLVTFGSIDTTASVSFDGTTSSASANTRFTGLTVAGQTIDPNVPPNTKMNLPGIGTLLLNQQVTSTKTGGKPTATANALVLTITVANDLLPVGAKIVVGHAQAGG